MVADRRFETAADRARQDFHLLVGIAAERVGEFHSFRISHSLLSSQVRAVTMNQLQDPRPQSRELIALAVSLEAPPAP